MFIPILVQMSILICYSAALHFRLVVVASSRPIPFHTILKSGTF